MYDGHSVSIFNNVAGKLERRNDMKKIEVVSQSNIQICIKCLRRELAMLDIVSLADDGCKDNNHQFVAIPVQDEIIVARCYYDDKKA